VVLLPQIEDRDIWAYFASLGFPREEQVRETLAALAASDRPLSTATLETRVELGRNRLESMLKVLDVDGAVQRVQGGWVATGRPWSYDADRYARVAEAREREQQAMLGYLRTTECRMRYLREQLDDPEATDCGRCDNCGGLTLSASVSEAAVAEAGQRLSRPGVVLEPRRMWPTALSNLGLDLKGKISAGAEPGRTVARLTDLGHGQALRALFREDTPDGPVPPGLAQAVMDVMKDWSPEWTSRPDVIVVVESATRPTLVRDLADGLSRVMQVPVVGTWAIRDASVPPRAGQSNSAQRVAAVRRRGGLDADVPAGATVLLVDDQVATGWTLTVAATAIRAAGASAVLPLALAAQG
jgi:ATP-dependent DNA helicase RecQ